MRGGRGAVSELVSSAVPESLSHEREGERGEGRRVSVGGAKSREGGGVALP